MWVTHIQSHRFIENSNIFEFFDCTIFEFAHRTATIIIYYHFCSFFHILFRLIRHVVTLTVLHTRTRCTTHTYTWTHALFNITYISSAAPGDGGRDCIIHISSISSFGSLGFSVLVSSICHLFNPVHSYTTSHKLRLVTSDVATLAVWSTTSPSSTWSSSIVWGHLHRVLSLIELDVSSLISFLLVVITHRLSLSIYVRFRSFQHWHLGHLLFSLTLNFHHHWWWTGGETDTPSHTTVIAITVLSHTRTRDNDMTSYAHYFIFFYYLFLSIFG